MDLSWILGHARVAFHHSKNPVSLTTKAGTKTTLEAICKEVTPPCNLNPLLFNGHLQTAWTAIKAEGPPIIYKRKIFESEDPRFAGAFTVDFVQHTPAKEVDESLPPRTTYFTDSEYAGLEKGSDDRKPMLISLHGLSGGSHEIYLRQVLAPLVEGAEWEAVVVNSRGCANSDITTGILYNARATWDMRQMVRWCRAKYPNRPLYAIGYSLGANILTNVRIANKIEEIRNSMHGSDLKFQLCSILVRKEKIACLVLRWLWPIPGSWKWLLWLYRGRGWA